MFYANVVEHVDAAVPTSFNEYLIENMYNDVNIFHCVQFATIHVEFCNAWTLPPVTGNCLLYAPKCEALSHCSPRNCWATSSSVGTNSVQVAVGRIFGCCGQTQMRRWVSKSWDRRNSDCTEVSQSSFAAPCDCAHQSQTSSQSSISGSLIVYRSEDCCPSSLGVELSEIFIIIGHKVSSCARCSQNSSTILDDGGDQPLCAELSELFLSSITRSAIVCGSTRKFHHH